MPADRRHVLVKYVRDEISKAIDRRDTVLTAHPAMKPVFELFKDQQYDERKSELVETGVVSPSLNKVLRVVLRDHCAMLVPADAAMTLVLRHGFKTTPSVEELMKLSARPVAVSSGPA